MPLFQWPCQCTDRPPDPPPPESMKGAPRELEEALAIFRPRLEPPPPER